MASLRGHMSIQSQKLAEPFRGKWMTFTRPVLNVTKGENGCYALVGRAKPALGSLNLCFDLAWENRLTVLSQGQPITVTGKVQMLTEGGMIFEECELSEPVSALTPADAADALLRREVPPLKDEPPE